jgi:hypothetical protein
MVLARLPEDLKIVPDEGLSAKRRKELSQGLNHILGDIFAALKAILEQRIAFLIQNANNPAISNGREGKVALKLCDRVSISLANYVEWCPLE